MPSPKRTRRSPAAVAPSTPPARESRSTCHINDLPEELLLKVFSALATIGPVVGTEEDFWGQSLMPFRTHEAPGDPHPGLRSYPFLGQVCRRFKQVLSTPVALEYLWQEVVVDFGHELITAVHTPIAWSDRRPTDEEFRNSFGSTRLSAAKILQFVRRRQHAVTRLVLLNSEGYWSDEGDFVSLQQKHNFSMAHFGMLVGMLQFTLQELQVQHCNDFFATSHGALSAIACLANLHSLSIEDCRIDKDQLVELCALTQLEELHIAAEEHAGSWAVGLDCLPKQLVNLRRLRKLELRGHSLLQLLPGFLCDLPLTYLDVSQCRHADLSVLTLMTGLQTLALQGLNLAELPASGLPEPGMPHRRMLPNLRTLTNLTALNLADNAFTALPACLAKLTALQFLDLSLNVEMQVLNPLTSLLGLPKLRVVDLRGVHDETGATYWSEAKCASMRHITAFMKAMKRRPYSTRVLIEVQ